MPVHSVIQSVGNMVSTPPESSGIFSENFQDLESRENDLGPMGIIGGA